ncbi:hypothetical protein GUH49_04315 [Xanthomonas citri pv. citri]|uniref:hypothetical protein n=1 Tax=Xanthomonas citri TaxID=346 RepID=UPI001686803C|nr:hypothetical protein [Xanthomonas citri]MBD1474734.1 hypothetical protein [Xanthomonas citri pv. citri]MBD4146509.1 hypothetical protein [Xanthomonas citri pv. citri]MBD4147042.1 hypothetical protein [Xanthomonas citri pv. citri]
MIARPLYALLASLALGACAHTAATPAPATVTETSAMNSSAESKVTPAGGEPSGPIRTAEDAPTRMLALIQAIDGLDDLTPDYLQSKMGVPVTHAAADPKRYGASAPLTSEWGYSFGMDQTPTAGRWFEFTFIPAQAGASPSMTEICGIDFETFTKKLENIGFVRQRNMVEDGRWMSDFFTRPGMRVEVFPRGEAAKPQVLVAHKCIEWVYIR